MRIHEGLGTVHGALNPFNVQFSERHSLALWSFPTTRLELSFGDTDREWENPYRSPRVQNGETPTVADDIYSLGMLFARLLFGTLANFQNWRTDRNQTYGATEKAIEVVKRSTHEDPEFQYKSVRKLAQDINPDTELMKLDIRGAYRDCELGSNSLFEKKLEAAHSHFQDARTKDWLSLVSHRPQGAKNEASDSKNTGQSG